MTTELWQNDYIQFTRLLAQILAVGLSEETLDELCDSMDLERSEVYELLVRAQVKWDAIKSVNKGIKGKS